MSNNKYINPKIITAILSRDRTTTTYKFALLRSLVECISHHHSHKKSIKTEWVQFPLGILIYYWLQYYFPIIGSKIFIPQMGKETPDGQGTRLAIRDVMEKVTKYYTKLGNNAFEEFNLNLHLGTSDQFHHNDLIDAARKIQRIIINMPMKYLGVSQFGEHYSLVRKVQLGKIEKVTLYDLIYDAGSFEIHEDLYDVLLELGPIIIGSESILESWASFSEKASERNNKIPTVSKHMVLNILSLDPKAIRETNEIRKIFKEDQNLNYCVWTGKKLAPNTFEVDHIIPFSIWHNNDLWNLLPTSTAVNRKKSDKIPSPDLINKSGQRIIEMWKGYEKHFTTRFTRDAFNGLGYIQGNNLSNALDSLIFKSTYLIEKRGLPAFEG